MRAGLELDRNPQLSVELKRSLGLTLNYISIYLRLDVD
jgi:hypothetical protein